MKELQEQITLFLNQSTLKTWQFSRVLKSPLGDEIRNALPDYMNEFSPKRMIWHIFNSVIPFCNWCNTVETNWEENHGKYGRYCSRKCSSNAAGQAAAEAWSARSQEENEAIVNERKITSLKIYGVDNPSKSEIIKQKLRTKPNPTQQDEYYRDVWNHSEYHWRQNWTKISPNKIRNTKNHLDHIFSIKSGYDLNIPSEIIGHWTNLQIISDVENNKKGQSNHKTFEKLYEEYNKAIL